MITHYHRGDNPFGTQLKRPTKRRVLSSYQATRGPSTQQSECRYQNVLLRSGTSIGNSCPTPKQPGTASRGPCCPCPRSPSTPFLLSSSKEVTRIVDLTRTRRIASVNASDKPPPSPPPAQTKQNKKPTVKEKVKRQRTRYCYETMLSSLDSTPPLDASDKKNEVRA